MALSCIIKRDNKKNIVSVSTKSGSRSILYDKIASIPLMENRERALSVFKTVYSNKFIRSFGNWLNAIPMNKDAYNRIKDKQDLIPEKYRAQVLAKASEMENPVLVSRTGSPSGTDVEGVSFYTTDIKPGQDVLLVDKMVPSTTVIESKPGTDMAQTLSEAISDDFTPVSDITIDGKQFVSVRNGMKVFRPEELTEDVSDSGPTYENGEPRLFFVNDRNQMFEDYGSALKSGGNEIRIGFVTGPVQDTTNGTGVASVSYGPEGYVLNNVNAFIPIMTASTSTSLSSPGGVVNYLIKKGYLSGEKIFDPETGSYYLTGAGHSYHIRIFNSASAYTELCNMLGTSNISMNDRGMIRIKNIDNTKVRVKLASGKTMNVSKEQIKNDLKAGKYSELDAKYDHFDALAVSLIMEDTDLYSDTEKSFISNYKQEEQAQKNAVVDILQSLGVRVIGMSDYIEKYQTKYGHEPSARALADVANNVIALAEDATLSDLVEETAHFLVEAYTDQRSISEVLDQVEGTEEWNTYAGRYYEIYGKTYEGQELDEMVRREILGKILARELQLTSQTTEVQAETQTGFVGAVRNIISGIRNWLKSALTTQRTELDKVIKNIRDLALSDTDRGFDMSLLRTKEFTLYSLSDVNKNQFLESKIQTLKNTLRDLRQISSDRAVTTSMTLAQLKTIEDKINTVESDIDKNEMAAAMNSMIATAEAQTRYLNGVINTILHSDTKDGKLHLGVEDRKNVDIINSQVLPLMNELRGYIRNRSSDFNEQEKQEYSRRIDSVIADINGIQSDIKSVQDIDDANFLDRLLTKLNVPSDKAESVREFFNKVQKDISFISRWFGIMEHSSNAYDAALGALIAKDNYNAMVGAQSRISDFLADVKKNGFDVSKFNTLLQTVDGKTSNYLRSALDYARYDQNLRTAQMRAFATVMDIPMTDDEIKDVVVNNKTYRSQKDGKDISFKPSQDRVNTDTFTIEQERKYSELMDAWHEENSEREYTDNYKQTLESIYEQAEKSLGRPVSQSTKEYLNAISRQKRILKQPFIDERGNFNELTYYKSSNYEEEGLLRKQKKEMASPYIYVGTRRVEKTGAQLRMAEEIQAIDNEWSKKISEDQKRKAASNKASKEFLDKLKSIQYDAENGGGEAALRVLMIGGHLALNDKFWNKVGDRQSSRTESNNIASFERMAEDIKKSTTGLDKEIDDIIKEIKESKAIIKEIISNNRDVSDIGEVNEATFTTSEKQAFKEASEIIEVGYSSLITHAKAAGLKVDNYLQRSDEVENEVNQSYQDALADSGLPEWQFASQHTTTKKAGRIVDFKRKIDKGYDNRYVFTISETNFLADELGIDRNLDKREFRDRVKAKLELMKSDTEGTSPDWLVDKFARNQVFSYYKRMAPVGYKELMAKIGRNEIDVAKMVEDIQNGKQTQDYGMDISYLGFEPSRAWTESDSAENVGRNPNYVKDHGYGRYMPKVSKYRDESYFRDYGIQYDPDGKEVATRNVSDWNMIQNLKDMKKEALSLYKERRGNIYAIPQISKSDIERLSNLGTSPKSTVRNFIADLCLDRVDNSLYGRTQIGENRDADDRVRTMPKYYIYDLENQDDVAHDLAYSYSMLMMQANLYSEKQNTIADAMGLEQMLLNKQFSNGKKPEATYAYQMFKDFFNDHYYGIRMNTKKLTVNIGGYTIDITRIMMAVERFMSVMNLALSPFVAATGTLTGHINLLMESAVGQYITPDSLKFAAAEFSRLAPSYINEIGDIDRRSKLRVIGERMGIFSLRERAYGAGYNRVARTLLRAPMYSMMEILNFPLDPQVMIATMDNVRYYNGQFYTFRDFKMVKEREKDAANTKREWEKLKNATLWNMVDVEDGKIVVRPGVDVSIEEVERQMEITRNQVRSLAQICNGSLNEENRTAATRNWILRFMTAHRGWLVIAAQRLWKSRGFNFQTMQEEEGLAITLKNMIAKTFGMASEKGMRNIIEAWNANKNQMDEVEKTNLKRAAVYAGTFLILQGISMLLAGWRDDDDDDQNWITQFGTYIGFRTINEIASQMPFIMELNIVDIINDPFVMGRKLQDLSDFSNYSLDKVTSGAYAGDTKLYRLLAKMTFLKQWYNIRTPEDIARASRWWQQTNKKSMMFFIGARPRPAEEDYWDEDMELMQ